MNNRYTITEFRNDYPDNDTCLHKLFTLRFKGIVCPKCDSDKEFTRVKKGWLTNALAAASRYTLWPELYLKKAVHHLPIGFMLSTYKQLPGMV